MVETLAANDPGETTGPVSVEAHEALIGFLYRAPIGLVQTALDGTIEMMNPKAAQLLMPIGGDGLENFFDVFAATAPELRSMTAAFVDDTGPVCDAHRVAVDLGPALPSRVLAIDIAKLTGASLMIVVGDATAEAEREQQELARQLRHAARVDALTSMPNRTALLERVQMLLKREPLDADYHFAVLHLNCDRFGQINDGFGHHIGDELLGMLAGRLRAVLRPNDSIGRAHESGSMAARVSGDEFVVLLEGLRSHGDALSVVGRLLDALAPPYAIAAHELYCGVSIGIAKRPREAIDADTLLQDASIAMGEAKRAGGNRSMLFESAMRRRAVARGGVEAELRVALAEQQLFVVYQPVVGFGDGIDHAAGVEALVRWRHPVRGIVPPVDFIGVAEETGLIGALGDFVLATACRQFVAWRGELGALAPRTIAVNLSRAQLAEPGFVASVERMLEATGMDASCLQLEVTESLAAQDAAVQRSLHALKALGLMLALDDFGTGYSSLSSLHLLPVDTVKIDRSFVCLADTSAHHRVLIEATVRVARSLGMTTVAEGIETETQAAAIRAAQCDKGQGYLYARPLDGAALVAWLTGVGVDRAA